MHKRWPESVSCSLAALCQSLTQIAQVGGDGSVGCSDDSSAPRQVLLHSTAHQIQIK